MIARSWAAPQQICHDLRMVIQDSSQDLLHTQSHAIMYSEWVSTDDVTNGMQPDASNLSFWRIDPAPKQRASVAKRT